MARLFYFYIDPISDDSHREKGTHPEAVDAEKTESSVILVAITVTENHQEIQLPQRCTTDGMEEKKCKYTMDQNIFIPLSVSPYIGMNH